MMKGMVLGVAVLGLDFLTWRIGPVFPPLLSKSLRTLLFGCLSYVVFHFGMTPFSEAPWPEKAVMHRLAQLLELFWWLQAAQLLTVVLDSVVLPKGWHRERLFQDVLSALIFLAAGIAGVAFVLQLPVTGLLATSGAVAVVLGLALQSTLNDVFSGVVLNATQPFRLGDWVMVGSVEGQVVETNWRATTLINGRGNQVVIPNSAAAKANIVNSSAPSNVHGVGITLEALPDVRPARVLEALQNAALSHRDVLTTPSPQIGVVRSHVDLVEYEMVCFVSEARLMPIVRNALYDLAHQHLLAFGIDLERPPSLARRVTARSPNPKRRLLANVSIFRSLDETDLQSLETHMEFEEYRMGEILYRSADASQPPDADDSATPHSEALYILSTGVAVVYLSGTDQREIRRMIPGDYVGQSSILSGVSPNATVKALTNVTLFRLDKAALTPLIQRRPDLGQQMCMSLNTHRDDEVAMLRTHPALDASQHDIMHWFREGMKRLHGIKS